MRNKLVILSLAILFLFLSVSDTDACTATTSCNGCGRNYIGTASVNCMGTYPSCVICDDGRGHCVDPGCHAECDVDGVGCPIGTVSAVCNNCSSPPPPDQPTATPTPSQACDALANSFTPCYNSTRPSGVCQDASIRLRSQIINNGNSTSNIDYVITDYNNKVIYSEGSRALVAGQVWDINHTELPPDAFGNYPDYGLIYCGGLILTANCTDKTDINLLNNQIKIDQPRIPPCQIVTATPTPRPTPTACPNPPPPTLNSPANGSTFVLPAAPAQLFVDQVINGISQSCGPNAPEYDITFGFVGAGNTFEKGWGALLTWHTGAYGRTGTVSWKAKSRYLDGPYSTYRESGWTSPWTYEVVTPTPIPTATTTPVPVDAWFQTQEGDVHAGGKIVSAIPTTAPDRNFSMRGFAGSPGIVSYNGAPAPNFGAGYASNSLVEHWVVKTPATTKYFSYFYNLLGSPSDNWISVESLPRDTGVYYADHDIAISSVFGGAVGSSKRIVVLVRGKVDITTDIDIPPARQSSLVVVASSKIVVANSVTKLAGVFVADEAIDSGNATTRLKVEGAFISGTIQLRRNLGADNRNNSAELFINRPDFFIYSNPALWKPTFMSWQELVP